MVARPRQRLELAIMLAITFLATLGLTIRLPGAPFVVGGLGLLIRALGERGVLAGLARLSVACGLVAAVASVVPSGSARGVASRV